MTSVYSAFSKKMCRFLHQMKLIRYIFTLALLLTSIQVQSQTNFLGTTNVPNNLDFNWQGVKTESFDINYYGGDANMAVMAGKMAEEALWGICQSLDFTNRAKYSIYIYLNANDLVHSNGYPVPNEKDNGITPLYTNSANVRFNGSYADFQGQIRTAVCKMLLEDYYFGGQIQASIQNTVLLYLPLWYSEGLTNYWGEGWTYEDDFWLSGIEKSDMLDFAVEGSGPIYRTARKSIWYFIAENYGKEKLGEIFYMTRLTRSVEDGTIHVLGITLKTLTEKWREFVHRRCRENETFREQLQANSEVAKLNENEKMLAFALHPKAAKAAVYMLAKNGKQHLSIYDFEKEESIQTPIEGGFKTEQFGEMQFDRPIAWSPDGNQLVTTVFYKSSEYLAWLDVIKNTVKYVKFSPALESIYQIAWSPDGKQLVCSGLRQGNIDLYRFTPGAGSFVQLTNDYYDDLYPVWSLDGQRIYHASTRISASKDANSFDANLAGNDIWAFEMESNSLTRITNNPLTNKFPVAMMSSFELLIRSDETGLFNMQKVNVFLGEAMTQTNLSPGIYSAGLSDSLFAYTTTDLGNLILWTSPRATSLHDQVATRTMLRQKINKEVSLAKTKQEFEAALDSIRKANIQRKEIKTEETEDNPKADTATTKSVKYYVFDDDEDKAKERKRKTQRRGEYTVKAEPVKPNFNDVEVKPSGRTGNTWVADRVTTRLSFDPVFKLSFLAETRLRDLEGRHQLTMGFKMFSDFRSNDSYFRYTNQAHRIDYQAELSRKSRYLAKNDFSSRYNATRIDLRAALPINRFLSVGASTHLALLDRNNMALLFPKNIDGTAWTTGAGLNLTYDHRKIQDLSTRSGTFARLDINAVNSLSQDSNYFATASFDIRKYMPIKRFVLATRLTGAWSQGPMQQRFFLGGVDEALFSKMNNPGDLPIESSQLPSFHYMEFVTPIRGFQFNGRNGTKYVVANAELRIPMNRIFSNFLNTNPLYSLELIPFFDIGTTWTQGNPLSQKNPIDTETINSYPLSITVQTLKSPFLMGFGTGARLQVFGYSTRLDLAWGVDDYTILTPRLHLSLGKNF